jgi:hypothetical protein
MNLATAGCALEEALLLSSWLKRPVEHQHWRRMTLVFPSPLPSFRSLVRNEGVASSSDEHDPPFGNFQAEGRNQSPTHNDHRRPLRPGCCVLRRSVRCEVSRVRSCLPPHLAPYDDEQQKRRNISRARPSVSSSYCLSSPTRCSLVSSFATVLVMHIALSFTLLAPHNISGPSERTTKKDFTTDGAIVI